MFLIICNAGKKTPPPFTSNPFTNIHASHLGLQHHQHADRRLLRPCPRPRVLWLRPNLPVRRGLQCPLHLGLQLLHGAPISLEGFFLPT